MRKIDRPPSPRVTVRQLREDHDRAMASLQALREEMAEAKPWDGRGRSPQGISSADLIEDVEWILRGNTTLEQTAERVGLSPDALRQRLTALKRTDLLERLRQDAA